MNNLKVLYEDNHIIVVIKPENILSQGDNTGDISMIEIIKDYLKKKYNKPGNVYLGLVHRLDRPVGGIMVFAKTSKAAARLTKSFQNKKIDKRYLAIIHGRMDKEGKLIDFIERKSNGNSIVSKNGKEAILTYKELDYNEDGDCSLVEVKLETGRHHQIRVQFASRGHYLLGDQRYGVEDKQQICLFCYYLAFEHPVTKEWIEFKEKPENKGYWTSFTV